MPRYYNFLMAGYNRGKTNDPGHSTNVTDSSGRLRGRAMTANTQPRYQHVYMTQREVYTLMYTHSNLRTL